MYGVTFSLCRRLWLTGAVGPQAVASRHSSTRPLAGGRLGAGIVSDITTQTVQILENSKTWLSIFIYSLMLWIDLWFFFFLFRRVLKK